MSIIDDTPVIMFTVACGLIIVLSINSCSMLTPLVKDAVLGSTSKGGINTELVVGDKEQVLGTNQEVKAGTIGKVTGTSDNSVSAAGAKEVTVNNNEFPVWAIFLIGALTTLIGYLAPRPQAWKRLIQRKPNEHSN